MKSHGVVPNTQRLGKGADIAKNEIALVGDPPYPRADTANALTMFDRDFEGLRDEHVHVFLLIEMHRPALCSEITVGLRHRPRTAESA